MTYLFTIPFVLSFLYFGFIRTRKTDGLEGFGFVILVLLTSLASAVYFVFSAFGTILPGLVYLMIPWGWIAGGYWGDTLIKK